MFPKIASDNPIFHLHERNILTYFGFSDSGLGNTRLILYCDYALVYDLPILERIKLANLWLAAQITDFDHKETGKCSSKWFDLCFYLSKLPGDILQDFIGLLHNFDTIKSLISHQQMFEEVSSLKILLKALISIWWQNTLFLLIMYASIFR